MITPQLNLQEIGSRFSTFRKDYIKLGQVELAEDLGITQKTLSFIETGRRYPNPNVLTKLEQKYRLNSDWILNGKGDPINNSKKNKETPANLASRITLLETQVAELKDTLTAILSKIQQ